MKEITWRALAWEGRERCQITTSVDAITVQSELAGVAESGTPFDIHYNLRLTADWQVADVRIESRLDPGQHIELHHDGDGIWRDEEGKHLSEFDGCAFIDISLTPFTNTLPIRGLPFDGGSRETIDVIIIDLPTFTMHKTRQFYTRIGARTYRFQDVEHPGFAADLALDEDQLVIKYPKLFTREEN